jgi:hypothetical protein
VPIINGTNHDESRLFVAVDELEGAAATAANYRAMIASTLGFSAAAAAVIAAQYPLSAYPSPFQKPTVLQAAPYTVQWSKRSGHAELLSGIGTPERDDLCAYVRHGALFVLRAGSAFGSFAFRIAVTQRDDP